jgi:uncharacterized protein YdaU (DUF1376 family)
MLIAAWRTPDCALPNDDKFLARITRLDPRTWRANKFDVLAFWNLNSEQKWVQHRLQDERNFVVEKRNKNARAGKASALKRFNRGSTYVSTPGQHNGNLEPTPTPTPTPIEEKKNLKVLPKEKRGTRIPDDFEPDASCQAVAEELLFNAPESQREFEKFVDYWKAKPGRDGIKLDWQATFRNWLRNSTKGKSHNGKGSTPGPVSRADGFAMVRAVIDEEERREQAQRGNGGASDVVGVS